MTSDAPPHTAPTATNLVDTKGDIRITSRTSLYSGFRQLDDVRFRYQGRIGTRVTAELSREVADIGPVFAVLPYDPIRNTLVLLRQFRIGAHLATGHGQLIEIVAGLVDPGERVEETARRETQEEAGVPVLDLERALTFLPSPGFTTEHATLFCARVASNGVPEIAGEASETEYIEPVIVSVDDALAALDAGHLTNAYSNIALSWFARNKARLDAKWAT
ncbi:MAG: NUDIX domain-containing protein [Pseudomonadota bacterium]